MERERERRKKEQEEKRHKDLAMAAGSSRPIEMESYYELEDETEFFPAPTSTTTTEIVYPSSGLSLSDRIGFGVALFTAVACGMLVGAQVKRSLPRTLHAAGASIDEERILEAYRIFQERTGISISVQAHKILYDVLNSIVADPHPSWRISPDELQQVADHYISNLPDHLSRLAKDERISGQINSFDVVHWLTGNIVSLCIIEKPRT